MISLSTSKSPFSDRAYVSGIDVYATSTQDLLQLLELTRPFSLELGIARRVLLSRTSLALMTRMAPDLVARLVS